VSTDISETQLALRVDNVHVGYDAYEDSAGGIKGLFSGERRRTRRIKAVRGVSFELERGQSLGIIGSNGSGKSTLLAAMTGLLPLESGEIWVRSRPTLLGVGAVMRPSLSGRRNIIIGGLALGLPLAEIKSRMRDVIAFAGLEESIDLPMRSYSSGMRARLMFAIATATTPEILLIDEALAVGDSEFFQRSQRRIDEIRATAGAVVIVSHNLSELERSCDRVIWMDRGELIDDGPPDEVIAAYGAKVNGRIADEALLITDPTAGTDEIDVGTAELAEELTESDETEGAVAPVLIRERTSRTATLHIGTDFTVDRIQHYLRAEAEAIRHAGFSTPAFLRRRNHFEFVGIGSENAASGLPISFGGDDWATWRDDFINVASRQMSDEFDWVISSEAFATRLGPKSIQAVRDFLNEVGFDRVHAVLYLQRQDRLAAHSHVQALAAGLSDPFSVDTHLDAATRCDWRRLIEWWSNSDSIDQLDVRLFPDRPGMPDIVDDFCDATGLPQPRSADGPVAVRLPSSEAVQFIEKINGECEDGESARALGERVVLRLAAEPGVEPFALTAAESAALMGRYAASNEWALAQVDEAIRVDDYFSVALALPTERTELTIDRILALAAVVGSGARR